MPYSEKITEVVRDLAAAGAGQGSPLLAGRDEVTHDVLRRHRRRPRPVRRLQRRRAAGHRGRDQGRRRSPASSTSSSRSAGRPTATSASAATSSARRFSGFSDSPSYADAKAIGAHVVDLFTSGQVDKVELVYTRFISAGNQEVVLRPLVPLTAETVAGGDGRTAGAPRRRRRRRLRVRARPGDDPRHAAAELRRGPHLRRPAQRRGVRARLPPAGDEGGDRQRRRAHQDAQPDHEPGPPGLDHHRDHGDRQRRRGPRRRRTTRPAAIRILDELEVDAASGGD